MENLAANNYDEKLNKVLAYYTPTREGEIYSHRRGKNLVGHKPEGGYDEHVVTIHRKAYSFLAHRLVAYYYIPNDSELPEVNHKDGQRLNNNVDNLEWVTREQNIQHAFEIGAMVGRPSPNRLLGEDEIRFIRQCSAAKKSPREVWQQHFPHINESTFGAVWYNHTYKEITE